MRLMSIASVAAVVAATGTVALAHATLETQEAEVGSFYKAVMRIGHGCDGEATLKVRITIPEGVISVKPMPKAGWAMETLSGDYEQSYDYYGTTLISGVKEIVWTGELADDHYDEFVFRAKLDDTLTPDGMIFFPTVQECASGTNAWVEIPVAGQDPHDYDYPAPGLHLKAGDEHAH